MGCRTKDKSSVWAVFGAVDADAKDWGRDRREDSRFHFTGTKFVICEGDTYVDYWSPESGMEV